MTRPQASRKQKKTLLKWKSNPFTALFAALAGAAMMVPVTAGVVSSSVHTELSGQLASLNSRLVQMQNASIDTSTLTPADIATVCGTPQAPSGHVLGASVQTASVPTGGGRGSGIPSSPSSTTFIKKIVTGSLVATATNSNTGPDSTNTIDISNKTTVTTTNDNDITLISHNDQHASSGDAQSSQNTTGGSATTGDATNTNDSNVNLSIKN
ncbi:MAG TPA: hypothetical protein VHD60_02440 [Candidatus Saccharimonadales bacterium]|nr:hypothetical protein [Candidatus Saccharimonadales bacterium]